MALDKDILGTALYNTAQNWNDQQFADINVSRQAFWKAIAEVIINHFKVNGVVVVPGTGLTAGADPVTGIANGTIE